VASQPHITIPDSAYSDLAALADHHDKIAAIVHSRAPAAQFESQAVKDTQLPPTTVHSIVEALSRLQALQDGLDLQPDEVISVITENLQSQASEEWKQKHLERWQESEECLAKALASLNADHPISISRKARHLALAHPNVLHDARIITDIRPVFTEKGDTIVKGIIGHVLRIGFYDGTHRRTIYFAMDSTDVANLKSFCERAMTKSRIAKESLQDLPWSTSVLGDDDA
jgi:hypothetical protein